MARFVVLTCTIASAAMITVFALDQPPPSSAGGTQDVATVTAQVVATGIPGAGAITEIGTFHRGGPFVERAGFAPATLPGHVLAAGRLFVASSSNFGSPRALNDQPEGSILSLDVSGTIPVAVPEDFAIAGGQATAAGGAIILYTAQSGAFLNTQNTAAATRGLTSVTLPLGISLNNGFGRPWFANAPNGSGGYGTITVIDPDGAPLAGAPSLVAGGVFAADATNRNGDTTHGLTRGALATALITKSPDGTGRAVFLAALADGSVEQVHVQKGVDGLVPAGGFTSIDEISSARAESSEPSVVTRAGMIFNWVPTRTVFVTDPLADRILAFDLGDDGTLLQAHDLRYIKSPVLHLPVDIAPAVRETAARNFASNSTLGGGSDFYVVNRGTNSVVRLTQTGEVVAVRLIEAAIDGFRLNGLAVSEDSRTIWLTATAPGRQGAVLRIGTFGAGQTTDEMIARARGAGADSLVTQGADMFSRGLEPADGLGPLFNGASCNNCHVAGRMGSDPTTFVMRVARLTNGGFDPLDGHGGPIARQFSVAGCGIPARVPPEADVTSRRSAMTLRGTALIDSILLSDIIAAQAAEPAALRGRLNVLADGRTGRFGWKAQTATLVEFMGEAFRDEIGLTNPLAARDLVRGCGASLTRPEADAVPLTSIVAFLNTIDPPRPSDATLNSAGATIFKSAGCAVCHTPSYRILGSTAPTPTTPILMAFLYSDLLLHDMGPGLADGFEQGSATGSEFRTAPLWRVSERTHFLHDGRAASIATAIAEHGGQASSALAAFNALTATDRQALMDFLNGI